MNINLRFSVCAFLTLAVLSAIGSAFPSIRFSRAAVQTDEKISPGNREDAYRANNVGVAQLEQFNYKEGVEAFRRALQFDPKLKIANINLAIALFNAQDVGAAMQAAAAAAELAPEQPQPSYILGLIAKNQNRTEDAIALFKKVLEFDPNDVGANVNLGQIYIQQRNYKEAETVFAALWKPNRITRRRCIIWQPCCCGAMPAKKENG